MSNWVASAVAERGLGHLTNGSPCQDVALAVKTEDMSAIALADGAGSAKLSDIGASIVVESVLDILVNKFDDLYYGEEDEAKSFVIEKILANLLRRASQESADLRELSSTLLCVAVRGERYVAMHVGDGVMGVMQGDELKVLSYPSNGEHANETIFINSSNAQYDMRLLRGRASAISGFVLMSDGSEQSLYDKAKREIAPAIVKLFAARLDMPNAEFEDELRNLLKNQIIQRTADDCSIALLTRDRKRLRRFHKRLSQASKNRSDR